MINFTTLSHQMVQQTEFKKELPARFNMDPQSRDSSLVPISKNSPRQTSHITDQARYIRSIVTPYLHGAGVNTIHHIYPYHNPSHRLHSHNIMKTMHIHTIEEEYKKLQEPYIIVYASFIDSSILYLSYTRQDTVVAVNILGKISTQSGELASQGNCSHPKQGTSEITHTIYLGLNFYSDEKKSQMYNLLKDHTVESHKESCSHDLIQVDKMTGTTSS
jgi:hypothetical protein